MRTKTLDLFVTETDYDLDEVSIGSVNTTSAGLVVNASASVITALKAATSSQRVSVVVRFVSIGATTTLVTVRSVDTTTFTVAIAVDLPVSAQFTCALVKQWTVRSLPLATRFQHVVAVELVAYALVGLSSLSLWEGQSAATPPSMDYVGLEIKELPGRTMSTNRFMQNMLAVLPTHMSAYHPRSWAEANDMMIFVPPCSMKTTYDQPIPAINCITPALIDRRGGPVTAARFHIWLRLTVLDQ